MDFFNDLDVYGDRPAVITEDSECIDYNALLQDADAIKEKVESRRLVFIVCDNCLESLAGYIGFLRGRVVPVLVSDNINRNFFNNLLELYRPQYVWLPKHKAEMVENSALIHSCRNYLLLKTSYRINYSLHDDLALLLTTSGSTGSPKLVRMSYKNIISNADSIAEYLGITPSDRPITSMPMSYTYGLSIINSHLLKGGSIVLTNKTLMDRLFWQLFKEQGVTSFGGVPYIYEMLRKLRFSRMDLPHLKTMTQAGGRLGRELSLEFASICRDKGVRFFVMYGQTEATARMSYLPPEYSISKAGSIGIAIPGGRFHLEDENGNTVNQSETAGELVYEGPNVTMGYSQSFNELSRGDENMGVLRTGDLAKRDEDGFYYIAGRKKRFLKLFGNRINLDEVEHMLKAAGYDCACTGEDDNMKVFVAGMEGHDQIRDFIAGRTGLNQAGFRIMHIEKIPRNEAGKILYSALDRDTTP
jgi:long-chain acyl-CoA synthetase